ncbi:polysaccharide deacetylase family protein [Streptacidiphilus sp. EB129]|uniref:polysaccharide deacetylase family protein n=1 Tax=Streptacidiphilus sp. EB129 TaxID=3156262 RepID=UPI003516A46F
MYHSVTDRPTAGTRALAVRPSELAMQLELLAEAGFSTVTMAELVAHWRGRSAIPFPARPVVLTFDDGYADFHSEVLPLLREHVATATLYVTTGWLADAGAERAGCPLAPTLSWSRLAEIAAQGVEIGGHSHSHPQLDRLAPVRLREELHRNRGLLEQRLQQPLRTFGYPYGYSDRRVRAAVREAGYIGACAVANALAAPVRQSPYALARLTVHGGTSAAAFRALVEGRGLAWRYARDRALTRGYAVVRRATAFGWARS